MSETAEPGGYDRFSALLGAYPALTIPRRFMHLNAYNLLTLQAELAHLEDELKDIVHLGLQSQGQEKIALDSNVFELKASCHDPEKGLQWSKTLQIREKLEEYYEASVRFQYWASAAPANKPDLESLRRWLNDKDGGKWFLRGIESHPWSKQSLEGDLTSLTARDEYQDPLSKFISGRLIPLYHNKIGHRWHDPISFAESGGRPQPLYYYPESHISAMINGLSTILSSLLPTISIFALYFIHSPLARMGTIMGFTFLFSALLTLITKVRRIDCFAATTAFAALQVVFVGVGPVGPT